MRIVSKNYTCKIYKIGKQINIWEKMYSKKYVANKYLANKKFRGKIRKYIYIYRYSMTKDNGKTVQNQKLPLNEVLLNFNGV